MKSLAEFLIENDGTSDNALKYRIGCYVLNAMDTMRRSNIVKRYKITKNNARSSIIRYISDNQMPIQPNSKELIKRPQWKLNELYGETELQLMHPDYYKAINLILKEHKKKHDILTIFQCSSKKPYYDNKLYAGFTKVYSDWTDWACISNPGIVPFEYSGYYPFRYDEWSIPNEKTLKEILGMTHKYRIVNLCRLLRYKREMGYKQIIAYVPNPMKDWVFETVIKENIEGGKDWCQIAITDSVRSTVEKNYPGFNGNGLINTRIGHFIEARRAYKNCLKRAVDASDKKDVEAAYKEKVVKESMKSPEYKVLKSISYDDIMKKFQAHIKDNMDDPSVDKGSNNLYYKSYYWTCLDILLIGLDGNLIEDIDGAYWDLHSKLKSDKDFEFMSNFIFAYKPLLKNDDLTMKQIEDEAYKLKIIKDQKPPKPEFL